MRARYPVDVSAWKSWDVWGYLVEEVLWERLTWWKAEEVDFVYCDEDLFMLALRLTEDFKDFAGYG